MLLFINNKFKEYLKLFDVDNLINIYITLIFFKEFIKFILDFLPTILVNYLVYFFILFIPFVLIFKTYKNNYKFLFNTNLSLIFIALLILLFNIVNFNIFELQQIILINFLLLIILPSIILIIYFDKIDFSKISNFSLILTIFFFLKLILIIDISNVQINLYNLTISTIHIGILSLLLVSIFFYYPPWNKNFLNYMIIPFYIILIFLSAQKGVIVGLIIFYFIYIFMVKKSLLIFTYTSLFLILVLNLILNLDFRIHLIDRFLYLLSDPSTNARLDIYLLYFNNYISDNFFLGSGISGTYHPHNIFIESLKVNGIFFMLFIIFLISKIFFTSLKSMNLIVFIIFTQQLLYTLLYYSLFESNLLWISMILVAINVKREHRI